MKKDCGGHQVRLENIEEDEMLLFIHKLDSLWISNHLLPWLKFDKSTKHFIKHVYRDNSRNQNRNIRSMLFVKDFFQRQAYLHKNRRHLSKSNPFIFKIDSILKVFPDAKFVFLVRDPLETIPSYFSLQENVKFGNLLKKNELNKLRKESYEEIIEWYKETLIRDPIEKRGANKEHWIWEYPNHNKDYVVAADVARGDGRDKSAFHVFDVENLVQVAEFRGDMETKDYGNLLVAVANEYNGALLVVENANIGWAVLQQVIDRGYQNTFYMSKDLKYVDVENQLHNKYNREERGMVAGFSTTSKTRPLIISKMESYIREKEVEIFSERTVEELFTFVWNGQRAEAMQGYNDDLVMSLALANAATQNSQDVFMLLDDMGLFDSPKPTNNSLGGMLGLNF